MSQKRGLSFVEKKKVLSKKLVAEILGTVFYCLAAMLLACVLVIAFGMKVTNVGQSMTPLIENGQELLIDRFVFKLLSPKRNDVVCFYPKGNTNYHIYIKRIVALPGETVRIENGFIYVDGVRLLEDDDFDSIEDPGLCEVDFVLQDNEYFVLGDNRNNSEDSRYGNIGAVNKDTMIGKVWFKLSSKDASAGFVK